MKVLEEAKSIPNIINFFNEKDQNPHKDIKKIILNKKIKLIVTIARGSSDCSALYASYLFAKFLGLPTYSPPPSLITLEKIKFDFSSALVFIISQSGLSEDLIECEKATRLMGAKTLIGWESKINIRDGIENMIQWIDNLDKGTYNE